MRDRRSQVSKKRKGREFVVQAIYQYLNGIHDFKSLKSLDWVSGKIDKTKDFSYFYFLFDGIIEHYDELNELIQKYLQKEKVLYKIDQAILLLGLFSLKYEAQISKAIIINECIELAKFYSGQDAHSFVNGVLDQYIKDLDKENIFLKNDK